MKDAAALKDLTRFSDELNLGHPELKAIEKEYCRRSLVNYTRRAWKVVEPAAEYKHGWHIDAIAEHLQAVDRGEIIRLGIAVPPGSMKSLMTAVFWPSYQWGPFGQPWRRVVAMSHSEDLAARDNLRTKDLVSSEWYQGLWGDTVQVRADQSAKLNFANTATGFRQAVPFKSITGKRGHAVLLDDPMSVADSESPVERAKVNRLYREALSSRMVDPVSSAIVLIMQRLHEDDPFGQILRHPEWGYDTLVIPMEFEPDRRFYTSIGWTDPRTEEGELMFPERFPRSVVERDKQVMGDYAAAGQLQQSPVPREGGEFEPAKLGKIKWSEISGETIQWCRGWDFAGTDKRAKQANRAAYTASVKVGYRPSCKRYVIAASWRDRIKAAMLRKMLVQFAEDDGVDCHIVIPKDPGQAGKDQAEELAGVLSGFKVFVEPQTGDKETRAEPFAAQVNAGNVDLIEGPWNRDYIQEMQFFPMGRFKDQIDASASAFNRLSKLIRKGKKEVEPKLVAETQSNWADPTGAMNNGL